METARDTVLRDARALAASGAWRDVVSVIDAYLTAGVPSAALIVLRAEALMRDGDPRAARGWLEEQARTLALSADRTLSSRAVNMLGAAHLEMGALDAAEAAFLRARNLGRVDQDDLLVARASNNLAIIASIRGHHEEAERLYASAVPAYQRVGHVGGIAESCHNLAIAFRKRGRLAEAEDHERRSAEFAREVGNERLVALTLVGRAEIALVREDAAFAEATARRAAGELARLGDHARHADALRVCGNAAWRLGARERARADLDRAVALAQLHENALIEAEARWARAPMRLASGETSEARRDAVAARVVFERLEANAELASVDAWLHAISTTPLT